MIKINALGTQIYATDEGAEINPPSYRTEGETASIQTAFDAGDWEPVPDPGPPPPEPDWTAFNTAMLSDADWSPWITRNPLLTSATTTASLSQDAALLQTTIETAISVLGQPDPVAAQRWQYIADANLIPIRFGEP